MIEGRVTDDTAGGAIHLQGEKTGEQMGPSPLRKSFSSWSGCEVGSGAGGRSWDVTINLASDQGI